jgi:hypothetical protein
MMSSLAGSETRNLFNWFRAELQVELNEVELNEIELKRRAGGAGTVRHWHGATLSESVPASIRQSNQEI